MEQKIKEILSKNITEASGCTEPVAIAYAAAIAAERCVGVLKDKSKSIKKITAFLSANVIKNANIVCLPGANGRYGIPLALAVGAFFGESEKELNVISGLNSTQIDIAEAFAKGGVEVYLDNCTTPLKITVLVESYSGSTAQVTIMDCHTNICRIEVNGKVILDSDKCEQKQDSLDISIKDVWDYAVKTEDFEASKKIIKVNSAIALEGLTNNYGLSLGKVTKEEGTSKEDKLLANVSKILAFTAGGTDARMAGTDMPVVANSGSGNQGLTTSLPVIAAASILNADEKTTNRAVILSNLVAIIVKPKNKKLSAYCGAVTASAGVSAALVYLCGGNNDSMQNAVRSLLGTSFGMLCDGAKSTCSLKIASCIFNAVYSAYLAMKNVFPHTKEGLVCSTAKATVDAIDSLCTNTSDKIDEVLINILLNKDIN